MKNQKGSVVAWTIVIIAILVVAGGIYFYSKILLCRFLRLKQQ